jgi:hypothetical protein
MSILNSIGYPEIDKINITLYLEEADLGKPIIETEETELSEQEDDLPEVVDEQAQSTVQDISKKADIENNDFVIKIKEIRKDYVGGKQFVNTKQTGKEFLEQINYGMYGEKVQPEHLLYFKDEFAGVLYDLVNKAYKELTGKTFEEYDAELAALEQPQIEETSEDDDIFNQFSNLVNSGNTEQESKDIDNAEDLTNDFFSDKKRSESKILRELINKNIVQQENCN